MAEQGAGQKKFADITDEEVLDWVGLKLDHRGTDVVRHAKDMLSGTNKQELLNYSVEHFQKLMEGGLGVKLALQVAINLHSSIHAGAGQSSQATERLNGNFLGPRFGDVESLRRSFIFCIRGTLRPVHESRRHIADAAEEHASGKAH